MNFASSKMGESLSYKSTHIRKWVSAALGAALLGTSLVTGLSAANASVHFPGYLNVAPGVTGGSGTVSITADGYGYVVTTYSDPRCVGQGGKYANPNMTASITIGSNVYKAPNATQWDRAQSNGYTFSNVTCKDSAGNTISGVTFNVEDYRLSWGIDYSCRTPGTQVVGTISLKDTFPPSTTIPSNGPLPASCTPALTFSTTPVPTITGAPKVGSTLTAAPGTWGPAPVTLAYQWKANSVAIAGATAATYKLAAAHLAKTITVTVTGTKAGYATAAKTSAATAAVAAGTLGPAPVPTITGTAKVGSTLTAVPSTWGPAPVALTYQWKANGVAITGATAATLKLAAAQAGKTITVTVTGAKAGYTTKSKTSTATAAVAAGTLGPAPVPTITGTAKVASTLNAVPGTWGPAPVALTYQWKANGVAITDATAATYKLAAAQAGKTITVTVTGRKTGYTTKSKTSTATAQVV